MIRSKTMLPALLATSALASAMARPAHADMPVLPTGANIAAGAVDISQTGSTMTVNQNSGAAIVNWGAFSVGQGGSVTFVQPDATSVILNRVTGETTSTIAGNLSANGQVYLINPNGVTITASGKVQAAAFVASSLGLGDDDFLSGKRKFTGSGASAGVSNAGTISIVSGGYAALIGGHVSNTGTIVAPLGRVGLGAGEAATLDLAGDGFLEIAAPTTRAADGALVIQAGLISADGGFVKLSAAAARDLARQTINMSGLIEARSVSGRNGSIVLSGGEGGVAVSGRLAATGGGTVSITGDDIALTGATLDVSGPAGGGKVSVASTASTVFDAASAIRADATEMGRGGSVLLWSNGATSAKGLLSARGGAQGGNGGFIETSGKAIDFTGLRVDASAKAGATGDWLVDPTDLTIDTAAAATISAALAAANVTLQTNADGTFSGVGAPSSGDGDIVVASAINWTSANTLTLDAYHGVKVNAAIGLTDGALNLIARNAGVGINAKVTVAGAGAVDIVSQGLANVSSTGLTFALGAGIDYGANDKGGRFSLNGEAYDLIYSMAGLQGLSDQSGRYALATSLDASGTVYGDAIIGGLFHGRLDGLGHVVDRLTIVTSGPTGLIAYIYDDGVVSNLGVTNMSITGGDNVGGLASVSTGVIESSYVTGLVSGGNKVGGLVGLTNNMVRNSFANAVVLGSGGDVGGLVGVNIGTVNNSYAMGVVSGGFVVGGLVGNNHIFREGEISNSLSTSLVLGGANGGGIVGYDNLAATISNLYWDVETSGASQGGGYGLPLGAVGLTTAGLQSGPLSLDPTAWAGGAGLYPYLKSFYPNGAQSVSGTAFQADGVTALIGAGVGVYAGGGLLGGGAAISGANGYYYAIAHAGAVGGSQGLGVSVTPSGGAVAGAIYSDLPVLTGGNVAGLNIKAGVFDLITSRSTYASLLGSLSSTFGQSAYQTLASGLAAIGPRVAASGAFDLDTDAAIDTNLAITAANDLTVSGKVVLSGDHLLGLTSMTGRVAINGGVRVLGSGDVAISANGLGGVTSTGLTFALGSSIDYGAVDNGGTFTLNGRAHRLVYSMADLAGLDMTRDYALATSLNAAGIVHTGVIIVGNYTGDFDGLGNSIANLTIASTADRVALFQFVGVGGRVGDLGLRDVSITGGQASAGLVSGNLGLVEGAYVSGRIAGSYSIAGLAAYNQGVVQNSFSLATVSGEYTVGGLVANNVGVIRNTFAMGPVRGGMFVGGLAGENYGSIENSYATGAVSGTTTVGGFLGVNGGAVSGAYWNSQTSGQDTGIAWNSTENGFAVKLTTSDFQLSPETTSDLPEDAWETASGEYPYLRTFFPEGVQSVSGKAYADAGTTTLATTAAGVAYVSGVAKGAALGAAATGADGYYYIFARKGALDGGVIASTPADAATGARKGVAYAQNVSGSVAGLDIWGGYLRATSDAEFASDAYYSFIATAGSQGAASDLIGDLPNWWLQSTGGAMDLDLDLRLDTLVLKGDRISTSGDIAADKLLLLGGDFQLVGVRVGTVAANANRVRVESGVGLTVGTVLGVHGVSGTGNVSLSTTGPLTIVSDATVSGGSVTLSAGTAFINNRGADAVVSTADSWWIISNNPFDNVFNGLDSGNAAVWGFHPDSPISVSGNRYLFAYRPTITVAANNFGKTYGDTVDMSGGYTATGLQAGVAGAYLGDSLSSILTGAPVLSSTGANASAAVGSYAVSLDRGSLTARNGYALTLADTGVLTVTPRAITISAGELGRYYGDANPGLTYAVGGGGLVNGDRLMGALATNATAASNVGRYAILQGSLSAGSNYVVTYVGGGLTVQARPITVTADSFRRYAGGANPALTYTIGGLGLVNGDQLAGALATVADASSTGADYAITQGSLSATPNYVVTFVDGVLSVENAVVLKDGLASAIVERSAWRPSTLWPKEASGGEIAGGAGEISDPAFDHPLVCWSSGYPCRVLVTASGGPPVLMLGDR